MVSRRSLGMCYLGGGTSEVTYSYSRMGLGMKNIHDSEWLRGVDIS